MYQIQFQTSLPRWDHSLILVPPWYEHIGRSEQKMHQRLDPCSSEDPFLDFEILLVNNLQKNFTLMKDEHFVALLTM
jgi:hypothetical protein